MHEYIVDVWTQDGEWQSFTVFTHDAGLAKFIVSEVCPDAALIIAVPADVEVLFEEV